MVIPISQAADLLVHQLQVINQLDPSLQPLPATPSLQPLPNVPRPCTPSLRSLCAFPIDPPPQRAPALRPIPTLPPLPLCHARATFKGFFEALYPYFRITPIPDTPGVNIFEEGAAEDDGDD